MRKDVALDDSKWKLILGTWAGDHDHNNSLFAPKGSSKYFVYTGPHLIL